MNVRLKEDFSKEDREALAKLWPLVQEARRNGKKAFPEDGYALTDGCFFKRGSGMVQETVTCRVVKSVQLFQEYTGGSVIRTTCSFLYIRMFSAY